MTGLGLLALVACGVTRVDGAIDGQPVEVANATYAEVPGLFGDDGAILIWLLPGDDACGTLGRWFGVSEASRDPVELANQWNTTFPSEFWQVDLVLRVADPLQSTSGVWLEGTAWDANTEVAGQVYADLQHHLTSRDERFFSGDVSDPDAWFLRWYSHRGLLQIHRHQPGQSLSGVFTTEAADPDTGARQGEIVIRFAADHCAELDAIFARGGT